MMKVILSLFSLLFCLLLSAQQTSVSGFVYEKGSNIGLPGVRINFKNTKIGTVSDSTGHFNLSTYYASDSLVFFLYEYRIQTIAVKKDVAQTVSCYLVLNESDIEEVVIRPPDESPTEILLKRVLANKDVNNKEKLDAYGYELYNKLQVDVNNIGDKFKDRGFVKRLDLVMNYLDSTDKGGQFLPVILSENISQFNYKNNPKKKKEVVAATRISGIENIQLNQFLGEMYLDFNVYDNYIELFQKSFVSPIANNARFYYKFFLSDSQFIDNQWCYKLTFRPKRTGDMTFQGELWIHDTTYAVKEFKATISPWANINYVQDLYMEHHFDMVQPEVWMLTEEKMIIDLKITKGTELYGFYGRKYSSRRNFSINEKYPDEFYQSTSTVSFEEGADKRDTAYWNGHRHKALNEQEIGINQMVDSLNKDPFFSFLKNATYMLSTGYYPLGKIEIGSLHTLASFNPVESFRTGLAVRTSNNFSRRIELGGRLFYGFGDERFKYALTARYNITPKKRGMLSTYYSYDIEQLGLSATAAAIGSTFGSLFRTGPLDKLTFVDKIGINLEKDLGKDIIVFGGFEWKEYTPLGLANYQKYDENNQLITITKVQSAEATIRFRWCKNEEFVSGAFDRTALVSKYPIFSIQGIFGIKGVFGSDYDYQKIEFLMDHTRNLGPIGRLRYGFNAGVVSGIAAYPFLKVHEGSQSYWLYTNSFNRMNFFEFISDKYVGGFLEQHWQGLLFDRIPLVKKLKWRLVSTARFTYGTISKRHEAAMLIPTFTKSFGGVPYVEIGVGIENIFKVGRVDLVWRATHLDTGIPPLGIRARWSLNF